MSDVTLVNVDSHNLQQTGQGEDEEAKLDKDEERLQQ